MSSKDKREDSPPDVSRRKFLKGCGITLLTTVSYQLVSVLTENHDAHADMCNVGCVSACVTSCTSCTTVNCMSGNVPEPSPPKCVQGFK